MQTPRCGASTHCSASVLLPSLESLTPACIFTSAVWTSTSGARRDSSKVLSHVRVGVSAGATPAANDGARDTPGATRAPHLAPRSPA